MTLAPAQQRQAQKLAQRRKELNGWITAEEFEVVPEPEGCGKRELVEGKIVEMPPPGFDHGSRQSRVLRRLSDFVDQHDLGEVVVEVGFILARDPDVVRLPDVAFVPKNRVPSGEDRARNFAGAPTLAVEVVSPSDRSDDVESKVDEYLAAGTKVVWIVNSRRQTVTVYRRGVAPLTLGMADTLDSGDVLPGFSCKVSDIVG
ncbi:MAG: Uma2 family endonuclease [Planctomycetota bacterium]